MSDIKPDPPIYSIDVIKERVIDFQEQEQIKDSKKNNTEVKEENLLKLDSKSEEIKPALEPKKKRNRCSLYKCKNKLGFMGVTCSCEKSFCFHHRFPEDHICKNLNNIRSDANKSNAKILEKHKVVADKLKDRL